MDEFVSDAFGDVQVEPLAPPAGSAGPLDFSEFEEAAVPPAPEANGEDHSLQNVVQLSTAESQAAFIGGYVPHPVVETPETAAPPAADDPRVLLRRQQQELLLRKDAEEAAAKKAAAEKAKAHVTQFNEERAKLLSFVKKANRDAENVSPEAGVPKGTTWEKVSLLIGTSDKIHTKDLSRFKSCLQTCKSLNVPVTAGSK